MKSHLVLLLTRDVELEQQSSMAAAASGARLKVTTTVGEALQAVCEHGREIDLVVIDFDNGTRGMTLLSALNILRDQLPIVALTSAARGHSAVLAYVEGAACCLTKPMNAVELEMVIRLLDRRRVQLNALNRKENQTMQTAESYSHNSDTRKAIETMKHYCEAHPQTPSAHRHPQLLVHGGVWIVLLGPSMSEGIAGFGYTVEAALRAFDAQYMRGSGKFSVNQTLPLSRATRMAEINQAGHKRGMVVPRVKEQTTLRKEVEP